MKTIKIIEGQVMVCEVLTPNFTGEFNPKEPKWYVGALQEAVARRMNKCIDKLNEAIDKKQIVSIDIVDMGKGKTTKHIRYAIGGGFVVASYEVLENLFNKFTRWINEGRVRVSYKTLSTELTVEEADQLFKSFVDRCAWTETTAMFDFLRTELYHLQQQSYDHSNDGL